MNDLPKKLNDLMESRGFNYKSLSLAAGLGETSVRDIIVGRTKSPKISTIKRIAAILQVTPEYFTSDSASDVLPSSQGLNENELGLLGAIQGIIIALITKKLLKESDLEGLFSLQLREFRSEARPAASEVMSQLLRFLRSSPSELEHSAYHKSPPPLSGQSKIKKSLENP